MRSIFKKTLLLSIVCFAFCSCKLKYAKPQTDYSKNEYFTNYLYQLKQYEQTFCFKPSVNNSEEAEFEMKKMNAAWKDFATVPAEWPDSVLETTAQIKKQLVQYQKEAFYQMRKFFAHNLDSMQQKFHGGAQLQDSTNLLVWGVAFYSKSAKEDAKAKWDGVLNNFRFKKLLFKLDPKDTDVFSFTIYSKKDHEAVESF